VWFALSTLGWCLFMIQDSVLTALGRAIWVPIENAVFSLVKLGLLAALASVMRGYGIFVSWTVAMLLSVIGVNVIVFRRLARPGHGGREQGTLPLRNRAFVSYFAADYACSVAWLSATNLMPVIVTAVAGATTNAYWALAYAVVLPLYAFAQNIGTSLMLHGGKDPAALAVLTRKATVQGARVLVPAVALLVIAAPYLLSLFGESYSHESVGVLRLLALGALPNFVVALAASVARVQRRLRRAVIALTTEAVLSLSLAAPLLHAMGVTGAAIAFVGSQCLVAVALILTSKDWLGAADVEAVPARTGGAG
jgi:O-antigen/teichoic acid export membrane protein